MTQILQDVARVTFIGIGATAVMDLWLLILSRRKLAALKFGLIGRWIGHMPQGRWTHDAIAEAAPVKSELVLGWMVHYAVGIAFAGVLAGFYGRGWARNPSLMPAMIVGIGTVIAPLFIMQPAMGAGIASCKTPAPLKNCLRSIANHTVFGAGLYWSALVIAWISR
jgi:hypothetical protein